MNWPLKFTFAAAAGGAQYGVLWNPYGTAVTGKVDNTVVTGIADPVGAGLMPPTTEAWITGFGLMTDAAGDAKVTIGYWDTVAAAFVGLYPILATDLPGGGINRSDMGEGIHLYTSATQIPAFRYDGANGGVISGDLSLYTGGVPVYNVNGAALFDPLLDEAGAAILDESNFPIYAN